MAEYVPAAIKNNAMYMTSILSWTLNRIANPLMLNKIGKMANKKRCLIQSETTATTMAITNAPAQGGTDRSWVSMALNL